MVVLDVQQVWGMMDRDAHAVTDGRILRKLWQLQRNKGDEPTVKLWETSRS